MKALRSTIRTVAVIGVGSMGAPIARHVLRAGYDVIACDTNASVLADLARVGARVAHTPAECAGAGLVIVLVTTPEQTKYVLLGSGGLIHGIEPEHRPLVAIMSTIPVEVVLGLGESLGDALAGFVDAPISGGLSRAEQGTLSVMVGGDRAAVDAIRPVFATFASALFHCGELGAGQAMKIVNNIVGNANLVIAGEAYRMATELGLRLPEVAHVLEASSGRNAFSADPDGVSQKFEAFARDRASFESLLGLMRKDMSFAGEIAARAGGQFPAIASLQAMLQSLGDETYDTWRRLGAPPVAR